LNDTKAERHLTGDVEQLTEAFRLASRTKTPIMLTEAAFCSGINLRSMTIDFDGDYDAAWRSNRISTLS